MGAFKTFWRDGRGSVVGRFGNAALVLTIGAVVLASLLDRATKDGGALIAFLQPKGSPAAGASGAMQVAQGQVRRAKDVDLTPTGSITRPIILDPCAGQQR